MSNAFILIGQCGGAWGLQGSLKIISWSSPRENIFIYDTWHLSDKKPAQVREEDLRAYQTFNHKILRSGRALAVNFIGIDTIDEALLLQGKYIYIFKQQLESLADEYYWHELVGMTVVNEQQAELGQVIDMLSTGVHDVLKIQGADEKGEKRNYLIPFLQNRFVRSVSRENNQIIVSWDVDWSA